MWTDYLIIQLDEMGKRYGLFYAFGAVTGAFAGIMAYGVSLSGSQWQHSC